MSAPLTLGRYTVEPPVVLAPMAGITNVGFRRLCREQSESAAATGVASAGVASAGPASVSGSDRVAGIFVCEMVMTKAIVERNPKTRKMIAFDPGERPRSLQLYGVDPETTAAAVRIIVEEDLADHIDLNFGCPVPRVTRRGGGSALPWKRRLFGRIVSGAVQAAGHLPVTVKMRKGIDDDHLTYVEAGLIAQEAGVAWVALHARTAAQRYSGQADWDAIGALREALSVPVLGNGDIWEADDAVRMMAHTGCAGVVVGRGCLGRPWLFADLARIGGQVPGVASASGVASVSGVASASGAVTALPRVLPKLGEVAVMMRRHAELLAEMMRTETDGVTDFRKHVAWYLKGFPVGGELRRRMAMASSLTELDDLIGKLDPEETFPESALGQPRGRTNSPGKVVLPHGWLTDRDDETVPDGAETEDSGG